MAQAEWISEPERYVRDAETGLDCHIWGHAPVQADGHLAGRPMYFRARHAGWSFTLCTNADVDAAALIEGKEPGFFMNGELSGYALWGDYGTESDASFMPYKIAERLIRDCAARYLADSAEERPNCLKDKH